MARFCDQCGEEIKPGAVFCSKCGEKCDLPPEKNVQNESIGKDVNNTVNDNEKVNESVNNTETNNEVNNTNATPNNNSDEGNTSFETKFCYNCGEKVSINAVACPNCGAGLTKNNNTQRQANTKKFCSNCGNEVNMNAVVCTHCGASVSRGNAYSGDKSVGVAVLLSIIFPGIGHFYIGLNQKGMMYIIVYIVSVALIFTFILAIIGGILAFVMWIWALIDVIKSTEALNAGEHVEDKLF